MLKKLISIFVFSIAIVPLVVVPACDGWLTYEVTICDVEFIANLEGDFWTEPDSVVTMTEEIVFWAYAEQWQATCWAPSLPFVNTTYATTPCASFSNYFLQSTFSLSFDREFSFENESIPANTNLLAHPQIAAQIETEIISDCDLHSSKNKFATV
ncbi:MAG: hypothetical protein AAFN10_14340, partial [Bacteroidota bacterium]